MASGLSVKENAEHTFGCVILSGGQGRRMGGRNKADLTAGAQRFAERICSEIKESACEVFLSEAAYTGLGVSGATVLRDPPETAVNGFIGPLGGILSCFMQSEKEMLFFVPCDMPGFRKGLVLRLLPHIEGHDAAVWKTRDGRVHAVCGLFRKSCVPVIREMIREGNYRMTELLSRIDCVIVETKEEHLPDSWLFNVNDPEALLCYAESRGKQAVLSVSGVKNTGKTTLLEKLVRELSARGIRAAVIKHDGHDFLPDVPGTDSFRLKAAGAIGTAVYSQHRYAIVKEVPGSRERDFFPYFPEADLLLLEGHKNSSFPKIEVLRERISRVPVCDPSTVLCYAADWVENGTAAIINEKPLYALDDTAALLETVIAAMDAQSGLTDRG